MQDNPRTLINFDEIDKIRAAYHSNLVATDFVKIYLDGVPTDALRIYTLGGAAALRREAQTGSIMVGKSADFIVLNRNLFKMAARQISSVHVEMTFFQGQKVYQAARASK